jgi:NADPH-dependent curcumin reductase CurA
MQSRPSLGYCPARQTRATGSQKHREDIVDGPENAPEAFLGMLGDKNFGKLLVPVS